MTKQFSFFITSALYLILCTFLVIYSYSQIDLNLTISTNRYYQNIQQSLLRLGYYNRSLSASILGFLFICLSIFYLYFLIQALQKRLSQRQIVILIGISTILLFAYPAFSHDIFNYMFDARIMTKYGLDPIYFRALDFPSDPWVRFMHWTHRYFPYGPGWLLVSLLPSYIGLGKFVLTLLLFKGEFLFFHLVNCWLIHKIMQKLDPHEALISIAGFAFNPLILIESIVSPHNEVIMTTFVLLAYYLLANKQLFFSIVSLFFSIMIKYVSFILIPLFIIFPQQLKKNLEWSPFFWLIALTPVVLTHEVYSWYFIPVIALFVLTQIRIRRYAVMIGFSLALLSKYLPFILTGEYNQMTYTLEIWYMAVSFVIMTSVSYIFLWQIKRS